ncbi:9348_t:CDS:10 [Acaulospora morrowiae]|uniref:Glutamyl-tRNA(Gln) amidotransferase subunit A, mitochondrial n=1 Tax=Acaulospora morrowiae TaxID=94023 RepID=A0A9N8WK85_9GLOM|nr:9348_t:CDS:10 [Acaulospora morrowiae]
MIYDCPSILRLALTKSSKGKCKLSSLSIIEARKLISEKKIGSTKLIRDCLSRIKKYNEHVNAFIEVQNEEVLLERAREAEDRFNRGMVKGPLDGIPVAYKDNFCTKELATTCGSNILRGFTSPYDATVVELLQDAGAIMIGKTNLDEFGMGSANLYSAFGPVYNPHKILSASGDIYGTEEKRVAGGSSGGSAAAVASGKCFAALGSDTGGSVRLPASYCGVVGFKPSYGLCSRWGLIAYANSLDTVGIITKTVEDSHLIFVDIISKYDERDSTSLPSQLRTFKSSTPSNSRFSHDLNGLRVGVPQEYFVSELSEEIVKLWRQGISNLRSNGAKIITVSCPNTKYALSTYYILAPAEASSNLARYDGIRYGHRSEKDSSQPNSLDEDGGFLYANTRDEGFGEEVKRRIMLGTYTLTAGSYEDYYLRAQKIRRLIQSDFDQVFSKPNPLQHHNNPNAADNNTGKEGVDVLITPVATSISPKISDYAFLPSRNDSNPELPNAHDLLSGVGFLNAYVNDVFTVPANLSGIPAISVPFGISLTNGYPIGLQLMAQYGDETTLFKVAKILESSREES